LPNKFNIFFFIIIFAAVPGFAAFGADFSMSAGGGGLLGGLFTRYTLTAGGSMNGSPVHIKSGQDINQLNYGGFLFFDATWAELSLSVQGGAYQYKETYDYGAPEGPVVNKGSGTEAMIGVSLLGKYPFRLSEQFTVFPLAGIEYRIAVLEYRRTGARNWYDRTDGLRETNSSGNAYTLSMWNSFLINAGAGFDFTFYPRLYLRTELLCGFRLQTFYEVDALEKVKKMANAPNPKLGGLTANPVLKIGIGYRFY
jgi:hypothetical protein